MRITNNMGMDNLLRNLNRNYKTMVKYEDQVSSGRRINRPSDDPAGTVDALRLRTELNQIADYKKNIDDGAVWLGTTEAALNEAKDIVMRLQEIAIYAGGAGMEQSSLNALALETEQLLEHLVQVGNSSYGDRYIFGGYKTNTEPFTVTRDGNGRLTDVTYNGDQAIITREIGKYADLQINLTGDEVFGNLFSAGINLAADLREGSTGNLADHISALGDGLDQVLGSLATVGARTNRLELSRNRLINIEIDSIKLLSEIEDVDIAEAIMKLAAAENTYKASLSVGARIIQPSLLDYLR